MRKATVRHSERVRVRVVVSGLGGGRGELGALRAAGWTVHTEGPLARLRAVILARRAGRGWSR